MSSVATPLPHRACLVCRSAKKSIVYQQTFSVMSSGSLLAGYDVAVCLDCGFAYADRIPSQYRFDEYYREMSKYEFEHHGGQESPYDLARFRDIAALAGKYIQRRESRIVDIGCATGRLLALLRDAGFSNVLGVDPSPRCAEAAKRLYDVPVRTGVLSMLPIEKGSVDFALLVGVLEHVQEARSALSSIHDLLAEDGRVYVEVPDVTRFADSPNAPFQEFSTEHINFFSPVSLINLMRSEGFSFLHWERNQRVPNHNTVEPAISAIFSKAATKQQPSEFDTETASRLEEYVRRSKGVDDGIRRIIDDLAARGVPIVVWGVGTHTQRLLASSRLADVNVRAFVDSNPRYHGKQLNGRPILPVSELAGRTEPVLISSRVYQHEIAQCIRNELKMHNEVILLY